MLKKQKILVFNAGSTSLKYKLFNAQTFKILKENNFQNLNAQKNEHDKSFKKALKEIGDLKDVKIIGHRVVHGGNKFLKPTLINKKVIQGIKKFNNKAPLHNPYQLKILNLSQNYFKKVPNLAVFDTAFFFSLPEKVKIYALPLKYYQKYGVQKFGFHGISHQYTAQEIAKRLKKDVNKINLITCHLGGGCSITAIKKGKAIDTSMGMTPLEGLVMMSRPGDLDPGINFYLNNDLKMTNQEIYNLFNFNSGIKGLFGTKDFQKLIKGVKNNNKKAKLVFDIFIYRIQKYISAYAGILGKVDGVGFTGGIGAGDPYTVKKIKQGFPLLNKIKNYKIKADEEKAIAEICRKSMNKLNNI